MALFEETIRPCEKGAVPLKYDESAKLLLELSDSWCLVQEASRLELILKTDDFKSSWAAAQKIAELSEEVWHHPSITVGFGQLKVEIYTHDVNGLKRADFIFAAKVDRLINNC